MPELPEVEHFRRLLMPLISQKGILTLQIVKENPPKKFLTEEQVSKINDAICTVVAIKRRGKLIAMELKCGKKKGFQGQSVVYIFVHMGMTGRISTPDTVVTKLESLPSTDYPPPYTYLKFQTSDGKEAAFSDPRKFGSVQVGMSLDDAKIGFGELAADAIDDDADFDLLANKKLGIKALLLDQKRAVAGVGNWVADEVLYQCSIHPDQDYLTGTEAKTLLERLKSILSTAIECLSSGRDFPESWLFHCRWDKRKTNSGAVIKDAKGRKITFIKSGGRTTAVVQMIQKKKGRSVQTKEERKKVNGKKLPKSQKKRKKTSQARNDDPNTQISEEPKSTLLGEDIESRATDPMTNPTNKRLRRSSRLRKS